MIFTLTIHDGRQGKHIPGHNNYQHGKSYLRISMKEAQDLINRYSGHGTPAGTQKERIDCEKVIGRYVDPDTDESVDTTMGIIHYSKSGTHLVPAKPR